MLDPAGLRIVLRDLALRARHHRAVIGDHQRARTRGPLIEGEDVAAHVLASSAFFKLVLKLEGLIALQHLDVELATVEGGVRPLVLDPSVATTGRITTEDRAYLANPPALPAVGAGDANCDR